MDNKELGKLGEDLACQYLKQNGYKILARNFVKEWDDKTKGEIDKGCKKPHLTKEEITELFKALEFTGCDTLDYYLKKNKQKYAGSIGIYRFKKKTT